MWFLDKNSRNYSELPEKTKLNLKIALNMDIKFIPTYLGVDLINAIYLTFENDDMLYIYPALSKYELLKNLMIDSTCDNSGVYKASCFVFYKELKALYQYYEATPSYQKPYFHYLFYVSKPTFEMAKVNSSILIIPFCIAFGGYTISLKAVICVEYYSKGIIIRKNLLNLLTDLTEHLLESFLSMKPNYFYIYHPFYNIVIT